MGEKTFFTPGRRAMLSDWAINLSVLFLSSGLVSEAFFKLAASLKVSVVAAGLVLLIVGVLVAPDTKGGS